MSAKTSASREITVSFFLNEVTTFLRTPALLLLWLGTASYCGCGPQTNTALDVSTAAPAKFGPYEDTWQDEGWWDDESAFRTSLNPVELILIADSQEKTSYKRAEAVFKLFASHFRPEIAADEIADICSNAAWVNSVTISANDIHTGPPTLRFDGPENHWFFLNFTFNDRLMTEFHIDLVISGSSHVSEEDAIAFFRGHPEVSHRLKLTEFVLDCPERYEHFTEMGCHVNIYGPIPPFGEVR